MRLAVALALLLGAYSLLLAKFQPDVVLDFDAGTENHIIAERYVLGATPEAVLVGSSLSRMLGTQPGSDVYNLSFSGGSPLTGLEIVLRNGTLPRTVFVETNIIERALDESLARSVFDEPVASLRRWVPAFRYEYRPANLALSAWTWSEWARAQGWRAALARASRAGRAAPAPADAPAGDPLSAAEFADLQQDATFRRGLAAQLADADKVPDSLRAATARSVATLQRQVAALRARNVRVVFVRMPVFAGVDQTARERFMDDAVRAAFPAPGYEWLETPPGTRLRWVDSLHLVGPSATWMAARIAAAARAPARAGG